MKKGEILKKEGLKTLRLEGSPYEMGYQHGRALKNEMKYLASNLGRLFGKYEGILGRLAIPIFRQLVKKMKHQIPEEFQEEIKGIADASGVKENDILLINLTEEFGAIFYLYLKPFIPFLKCSAFVSKDAEGNIIWGRNLDYLFYEDLPSRSVLFVYLPDQGFPFISLGWPAVIGAPTAISKDFSLILLSSPARTNRIFSGIPQEILTRQVIQYSQNLDEAVKKIISAQATVGQNLVLVSQNDAKVVEISPIKKTVRSFDTNEYINVTNHFQVKEMEKEQGIYFKPENSLISDDFYTLEGSKRRQKKMEDFIKNNKIDPQKGMEVLNAVAGAGTVQSVVCTQKELWVAKRNQSPVTKGEWIHFQIDDLL